MNASRVSPNSILLLGASCVLAVLIGLAVTSPFEMSNLSLLAGTMALVVSPLILKYHHALVVCCWNAAINVVFLPGNLTLPAVLIGTSVVLTIVHAGIDRNYKYYSLPGLTWPLIALAGVVFITIMANGGVRSLTGGLWGAKRYFNIFVAIAGYFAITAHDVPSMRRRIIYATLYFLSAATYVTGDLLYIGGIHIPLLMAIFPSQAEFYNALTIGGFARYAGIGWAGMAVANTMLCRFGLGGIARSPFGWRLALFMMALAASLVGGHRVAVLLMGAVLISLFFFEGKLKPAYWYVGIGSVILALALTVVFAKSLPLPFQRALSFLPIEINPDARKDASNTLEWRLLMWRVALPEVSENLWVGKGYLYSASDHYLATFGAATRLYKSYEFALVDGTYHNGFLTLVIPFSLFGLLAFLWFCWGAIRMLWVNYRYGASELIAINTFLISLFCARVVFFFTAYGQFDTDLAVFTGIAGLSVLVNGQRVTRERMSRRINAKPQPHHSEGAEFREIGPKTR